ncbi:MAG: hypothetical protein R6U66_11820 [Bacteroidales bacterium]
MEDANQTIQTQINQLNEKMDLVLHYVNQQRLKSEQIDDLVSDLSIIGKDAFTSTVDELDKQGIELDVDSVKALTFKFLRNIENISQVMSIFESFVDLSKDVGPIITEVGVDVINKLAEFERKGYFENIRAMGELIDSLMEKYSAQDIRYFTENIELLMSLMGKVTDPVVLRSLNKGMDAYKQVASKPTPEYSLWKTFGAMRSPEMRKNMGFMMTMMKEIQKQ